MCLTFRYGRITVSTLETKLASAEKDVTRLTKALERSDKYIEELETELDGFRGKPGSARRDRGENQLTNGDILNRRYASDSKVQSSKEYGKGADNPSRRQLFSEDKGGKSTAGERSKYYYDGSGDFNDDLHASKAQNAKTKGAGGAKKKVTFDLDKNTNSALSFDLELPSPLKTSANSSGLTNGRVSPVKGVLKKNKPGSSDRSSEGYSTDMSKTLDDSLSESYDRYKPNRYSKDDDLVYLKSRSKTSDRDSNTGSYSSGRKYSADDSMLSEPSDLDLRHAREHDYSSKSSRDYRSHRSGSDRNDLDQNFYDSGRPSSAKDDVLDTHDLDDTQYIESELDELNISVTPEFTDCMKILNRAEKNVHRDSDPEDFTSTSSRVKSVETNADTAFRASTGSMGYKSGNREDDYLSSAYKTDTSRFTSSLDSYSRGHRVRSGSLDNLLNIDRQSERERPSSALPTTSNMYPPTSQSKYSSGLTTGRTSLTRTPSLDNLLLSRPDPAALKTRAALPGYLSSRLYRGENDGKIEVKSGTSVGGVSSAAQQPVAASHEILPSQISSGVPSTGDSHKSTYDAVLDVRAKFYSGDTRSGLSKGPSATDSDRKLPPTGRSTPTLQLTGTGMDYEKPTGSGRITPTIPAHSEYMSLTKSGTDKYTYTSTGTGRSTPTLTSNTDYSSRTNTGMQFTDFRSSGPSSLPSDLNQKPAGTRPLDPSSSRPYSNPIPATNPASHYSSSGMASYNNAGEGYNSLPSYIGSASGMGAFDGRSAVPLTNNVDVNKYPGSLGARSTDYGSDKLDYGASANYRSDSKYSASSSMPGYNDQHYKDGTDFSKFSTKVAISHSGNIELSSLPSANSLSASSTGHLSYPGSSTYLPSSLTSSITASTSYSTAHSVPLTHTTTSYTSSVPSNSYLPKPLDPIAETGHYSYVSNMSGDYSSKNDTFALPEPKKRLFENSDELDMSMSPIKSNRRY